MEAIKKTVLEVSQQFNADFQQHVLKHVRETLKSDTEIGYSGFKQGSYGKVVDLEWGGTACVGKALHSIFFAPHTDCDGMHTRVDYEILSRDKTEIQP